MSRGVAVQTIATIGLLAGSLTALAQDAASVKGGQDPFGPY